MYADLSPYEIARLKNIQENKKKLEELGLLSSNSNPLKPREKKIVVKNNAQKKKRKYTKSPSTERKKFKVGTRRSSRLAGIKISDSKDNIIDKSNNDTDLFKNDDEDEEEELGVNYEINPQMPQELDDYEFEIYTAIRKWRLDRKNELQIEPYKICQNRTICELIRRRRRDKHWALPTSDTRPDELIECWGIGPSKSETYGVEMIEIVDQWEETLQKSREI